MAFLPVKLADINLQDKLNHSNFKEKGNNLNVDKSREINSIQKLIIFLNFRIYIISITAKGGE